MMGKDEPWRDLYERVRADRFNLFGPGTPVDELNNLQNRLRIAFPPSYVSFLEQFDGGQFAFGRMHCITKNGAGWHDLEQECKKFFSAQPLMGLRSVLPFASTPYGDVFLFDLAERTETGECPVVRWDPAGDYKQMLMQQADDLPGWIEKEYKILDQTPYKIELYVASNADLSSFNISDRLSLTPVGEESTAVRIFLQHAARNKYRVEGNFDWKGYRGANVPSGSLNENALSLASLGKMSGQLQAMTEEVLELYTYSTGEMSSLPAHKTVVGNLPLDEMGRKVVELKAGDHLRIGIYGEIEEIKPIPLANHVKPEVEKGKPEESAEIRKSVCGFCGRTDKQAGCSFIEGISAIICTDCLDKCVDLVS
jgi:hypothetical protein